MSIQQFCLRWNNHQPNFISVFTNLLNSESLVDVTLAAEGRHLQAHRVVLSACSTYFQTLFSVNPCQHPIVILKDVKYNDLKTMVDFMYYGEVNVSQEQLPAILKTAETLKIKGLAEMPEQNIAGSVHMTKSLSVSSDKAEVITPGDTTWGPDSRCSPAPLSPSLRRKRLRKSSTGSGSGSTERTSEELPSEITLVASPALIKPEPIPATPDGESGRSEGSLRNSIQEPSTDSEPREGSQDSVEDDHLTLQISQDSSAGEVDPPIADTGPSTSQQPTTPQEYLAIHLTKPIKQEEMELHIPVSEIRQTQPLKPEEMEFHIPVSEIRQTLLQVQEDKNEGRLPKNQRKTCYLCPPRLKRKTSYICLNCRRPICLECAKKFCLYCSEIIFKSNVKRYFP